MRRDLYPEHRSAMPRVLRRIAFFAVVIAVAVTAAAGRMGGGPKPRFFKGNTHTHSLWSDGDAAPEHVAKWYKDHGYAFLVLSDHNLLLEGEKWFPISEDPKSRLTNARVEELKKTFGEDQVVLKKTEKGSAMRLSTLAELRRRFEKPDEFLFIQGEEVTDAWGVKPVHINAINVAETVLPRHGKSVREIMNANLDAILEQGVRLDRPVIAHVNHPNFGWGITWEDLANVVHETLFEVYNGHPAVRRDGDETHESIEKLWDLALTTRLLDLHYPVLYGVATDDSHSYFTMGGAYANPGRGWVMVRSAELDPKAIVQAMKKGDFYASSGVTLEDFSIDGKTYEVKIAAEPGVTYKTTFIGTLVTDGKSREIGVTLAETDANPAIYEKKGDEIYVRAVVTSSKLHPNPYQKGDFEKAWLQPAVKH